VGIRPRFGIRWRRELRRSADKKSRVSFSSCLEISVPKIKNLYISTNMDHLDNILRDRRKYSGVNGRGKGRDRLPFVNVEKNKRYYRPFQRGHKKYHI
jgi:hypothetical protein